MITDTKLTETETKELAYMYYGYYAATNDAKKSMQFIQSKGWNPVHILNIRRYSKRELE
jgi:hypothetical protein